MKQKLPLLITLFGMFLGVFIAVIFGINEEIFKNRITDGLQENPKVFEWNQSQDPDAQIKKAKFIEDEAGKNWRYYQRFHFHATGISAMSLGTLILLTILAAPKGATLLASYLVSLGGFFYPFVWLFAGLYGPSMGRSAAKETFAIFGYMGGVFMLGILFVIYLVARYPLKLTWAQNDNG